MLVFLSSLCISQGYPNVDRLCNNFENWFASDIVPWNYEDSLASCEYNDRLFDLYYPVKEFYFNGTSPYNFIYDIHHYDTSLLFLVLKLYADSIEEYDRQFGIPITLATNMINNDAFIIGTVVDKIDHYKECRFYTTTYVVRADSVVFSYFPIEVGDTVLIHSPIIGYNGYCQANKILGYSNSPHIYDYQIGNSDFCFFLDRKGYDRHFQFKNFTHNYLDPFCSNSFICNLRSSKYCKQIKEVDQKKLSAFIKKIKTWYK